MANRRMFSLDVVDTDRFLDMSASAQACGRFGGGHVHYMAVRNCISYPVWDYLYHSYIGIWIRAGNRHRDD